MPTRLLFVAVLAATACGAKSSPTEEQAEPVARTPDPQPEPESKPEPEPEPKPEPKPESDAKPEPTPAPAFALVARRPETDVGLLRLQSSAPGSTYLLSGPQVFVLRSDGGIDHEPKWVRGIEYSDPSVDATANVASWDPLAIYGEWPNATLLLVLNGDDVEPPAMFSRKADGWSPHDLRLNGHEMFAHALGPWLDDSMLVLVTDDRDPEATGTGLMMIGSASVAPSEPGDPILAFASSSSGEVIAIIEPAEQTQIWTHRAHAPPTRVPVPGGGSVVLPRVVMNGEHAWVFGGRNEGPAYVAHREGEAWKEVAIDCDESITSLSVADDGSAWVVCPKGGASTLLRKDGKDGKAAWAPVLGAPSKPHTVVARTGEDVWVLAGDDADPSELWHTGTSVDEPIAIPHATEGLRASLEWADAHPVDKTCARVWVPVTGSTTAEALELQLEPIYDGLFPQVRTVRVQGRQELGVMLPNATEPPGAVARAKKITDKLGADAGEPSCNERPQLSEDQPPASP